MGPVASQSSLLHLGKFLTTQPLSPTPSESLGQHPDLGASSKSPDGPRSSRTRGVALRVKAQECMCFRSSLPLCHAFGIIHFLY